MQDKLPIEIDQNVNSTDNQPDGVDELPSKPGIYVIMNRLNCRFYVGSASNIRARASSHRSEFRRGMSGNMLLRLDVAKCGADKFLFFTPEVFETETDANSEGGLLALERWWILKFGSHIEARGYNCKIGSRWTLSARFRDRERKLMRRYSYYLLPGLGLYDAIQPELLDTWIPSVDRA
jgi:hypothetical protein